MGLTNEQLLRRLLIIAVSIILIVLLFQVIKLSFYYYHDLRLRKGAVCLKVLPKQNADIKEVESLIRNLHAMLLNTKFRSIKYGRPYMSYEIAAEQGRINFYIWVPGDMKDRIVDRIYDTYSNVAIEDVDEYIPNNKKLPCNSADLKLAFHHTLKIKTKHDNLGSILAAMRDLDKKDFVAVQVLVRPIDNRWQIQGRRDLEKFERSGIRPGQKGNFKDKVDAAKGSILSDLSDGLRSQGINLDIGGINGGNIQRKTKLDRKEIVVASEKVSDSGFETIIRIIALGKYRKGNTTRVKSLVAAFAELSAENKFKRDVVLSNKYTLELFKNRKPDLIGKNNILTPPELASIFLRLPGKELIEKYDEVEKLAIKEFNIPSGSEGSGKGIIFAENSYRAVRRILEFKDKDIVRHVVVQGKTGTGKSEFAKTPFLDQISNKYDENGKLIRKGRGAMVLEPHGKLGDELLELVPEYRRKDTIVFDIFSEHPWPFNFCKVPEREAEDFTKDQLKQKTIDESIEIFKRTFSDVWSEKNEYYIENAIRTIIDAEYSMVELPRLFSDKKFRKSIIPFIKDPKVKRFWETKFAENNKGQIDAAVLSTAQSVEYKLDKFIRSTELRRALGQNDCIDFKEILDENKIIIFKFSKDKIAKDKISFLGGIAMKLLIVAAFARDKKMWEDPFLVFIDEAQNFINESIKDVLYELRKYGIGLFLFHQEIEQMKEVDGLINAIYNNVGTSITFTTGDMDAPFFAKKYGPKVDEDDLKNLPSRYGYCKLLVNGKTSDTFNIRSLDRPTVTAEEASRSLEEILEYNKEGKMHIDEIDAMIAERFKDEDEVYDEHPQIFSFSLDENEGNNIEPDNIKEDNNAIESNNINEDNNTLDKGYWS